MLTETRPVSLSSQKWKNNSKHSNTFPFSDATKGTVRSAQTSPSPVCLLFKRVENVGPVEGGTDRAAPPRGKNIRMRHKYLRLIRSAAEPEFLQVKPGTTTASIVPVSPVELGWIKSCWTEEPGGPGGPGEVCRIIYSCPRRTIHHFHSAVKRPWSVFTRADEDQ